VQVSWEGKWAYLRWRKLSSVVLREECTQKRQECTQKPGRFLFA
jgi:hypothetical protein